MPHLTSFLLLIIVLFSNCGASSMSLTATVQPNAGAGFDCNDVKSGAQTATRFSGPAELKSVLLARKDQFARTLAAKTLTFCPGWRIALL
jgi:hypothetical protein